MRTTFGLLVHTKRTPLNSSLDMGIGIRIGHSLRTGISFGLTSAVITTLGLMVGLHSGTGSRIAVIGGIFTIAIADAFSDALGIHISEESEDAHTAKEIWTSTISTFLAKFLFAMTFVAPVLLLSLPLAIIVSIAWGLLILTMLSYVIARAQGQPPWKTVGEHILIAIVVIVITHWVGHGVAKLLA
jgi:VIT1/CCC1 family predicted Fe2+/Mn2+ transporter